MIQDKGNIYFGIYNRSTEPLVMRELLLYVTKGLAVVTSRLRQNGICYHNIINHLINDNLFMSIPDANPDVERLFKRIEKTLLVKQGLLSRMPEKDGLHDAALWNGTVYEYKSKAKAITKLETGDENVRALRAMVICGLKEMAAYLKHASAMQVEDGSVNEFLQDALAQTLDDLTQEQLLDLVTETGKNLNKTIALSEKAKVR